MAIDPTTPRVRKRRKRRVRRQFLAAAEELRRRRTTVSPNSPFIDATLAHWQPLSKRALTREDAREIIENISGFFAILLEWDAQDRHAVSGAKTEEPD